jgi:CDP-glucose 4,6-dehydratase
MNYSRRDWKDKAVLVTGATGMLGYSVKRLLLDAGADVTAMVRDASTCPESCTALVCDITDVNSLFEQLRPLRFDYVLHLAAQSQVEGHEPISTFGSNISGTANLLEVVRISKSKPTIIVASTESASGNWGDFAKPSVETTDLGPYPASKMCAEILAQCYASSFDMSVGVVRLTNLYGPYDRNIRRLVPGTINSVLNDEMPEFRNDPHTLINFVYVDDAAAGVLRLAEQIAASRTVLRTVSVRNQLSQQHLYADRY